MKIGSSFGAGVNDVSSECHVTNQAPESTHISAQTSAQGQNLLNAKPVSLSSVEDLLCITQPARSQQHVHGQFVHEQFGGQLKAQLQCMPPVPHACSHPSTSTKVIALQHTIAGFIRVMGLSSGTCCTIIVSMATCLALCGSCNDISASMAVRLALSRRKRM